MSDIGSALGLGSSFPLFLFGAIVLSIVAGAVYFVSTTQARARRHTVAILGELGAITAKLSEGERLGKFGTFAWDFEYPEKSFWSEQMYVLSGLVKRRHIPSVEDILASVHEEDREHAKSAWNAALQKSSAFSFTYRTKGLEGEIRNVRVEGSTKLNISKRPSSVSGVIRDITKEVEVDRAKSEFVSLASHQLKTPLTAVRWYSEALMKGAAGELSVAQLKYVGTIEEANRRMIDLVNELLNISRIELNTFSQNPEEIDLRDLVDSVVEEQRQTAEARQLKLNISIADVPHIVADKAMARMVFQNLISNAIKYTPNGGTISCTVEVGGAKKEGIFVRISDTGIGIPKKDQSRVFEKLHRASNARVLVSDGTGLGLYVVKLILEHAGGGITFESTESKGTTFFVTFPLDWRTPQADTGGSGR